jgi:xanthine dehydrogenase YagS FAD-binding subunit
MKTFNHVNPKSVSDAVAALAGGKAVVIAGGTDLIGRLKDEILPTYPVTVVNLKTIPNLDYIKEEGGLLKIGAGTHLADIAIHPTINQKYTALAQAAGRVASPHIREMGTIGGNISQLHRCWYFRIPDNRFNCIRKGGATCFALKGQNRYHSIFGVANGCAAVNPGDTAPALVALDAKIVTSKRTINAQDFWDVKIPGNTVLATDEIVTEIHVPTPAGGANSAFLKFALRNSIDFPIVNCAVAVSGGAVRICLNAVAPKPYRATKAEEAITGKPLTEANAETAGEAAVAGADPLDGNKYKVQIAKVLVKRTLLACAQLA